ncbi:hypothetical protein M3593_23780, partial [Mesobacillus sp. MER 48]
TREVGSIAEVRVPVCEGELERLQNGVSPLRGGGVEPRVGQGFEDAKCLEEGRTLRPGASLHDGVTAELCDDALLVAGAERGEVIGADPAA